MPERRLKTQRIRGDNERHRFTDSLESYVFEGRRGGARGNEKRGHDLSPVRIRFENATPGPTSAGTSLYHPQFPKCIKRIKFSSSSFWPPLSWPLIAPFSLDPPRWKSWRRNIYYRREEIGLMEFSFCQWDGTRNIRGCCKSNRGNYWVRGKFWWEIN